MVRIARRVQAARRGPIDPGYASPTSNNQAATTAPTAPLDPTTRFGQPLLLDWTPTYFLQHDQSPHTENIEIYTNAEEVELFLNDKSLGTQKLHSDASPITYQVPFEPGTLKAVARTAGKIVATNELRTAGKPARLLLSTGLEAAQLTQAVPDNSSAHSASMHRETLPNQPASRDAKPSGLALSNESKQKGLQPLGYVLSPDWNDVAYATATLVDANNTVIPDSATIIHFTASGPGKVIAVDNGNFLDHDPFQTTDRKLYEGHALAILRATAPNGNITLTATTEGLPPATITIPIAPNQKPATQRSF
jgi:beta-galactosidase